MSLHEQFLSTLESVADIIEVQTSIVSCIDACDELHTITSLSGFDAMLRGKPVVTYGVPFYAGWGLTLDCAGPARAWARRTRELTLQELVAGALLLYPSYWNLKENCEAPCEAVFSVIAQERNMFERTGRLERLRSGVLRRQLRKIRTLACAWLGD